MRKHLTDERQSTKYLTGACPDAPISRKMRRDRERHHHRAQKTGETRSRMDSGGIRAFGVDNSLVPLCILGSVWGIPRREVGYGGDWRLLDNCDICCNSTTFPNGKEFKDASKQSSPFPLTLVTLCRLLWGLGQNNREDSGLYYLGAPMIKEIRFLRTKAIACYQLGCSGRWPALAWVKLPPSGPPGVLGGEGAS